MAGPASYTTDLSANTIVDFDGVGTINVDEPNNPWAAGRSPTTDTDFPIQGSTHASLTMNSTGQAGLVNIGSTFTWTSGDYLFGWLIWLAPGAIATQASDGLVMIAGDGVNSYKTFQVGGSDYGAYPYGGWQNFVVDPTIAANGTTVKTAAGNPSNYYVVGAGANVLSAVSKGNPLGIDVFRYGRGELQFSGGDQANGFATFAGFATENDNNNNRWGLLQLIEGGYKYKGLMILGAGAAVEFEDSNTSIVIDNTEFVSADFNRIEIRQATSTVKWNSINITSLGTTSKGQFECIDNASVELISCNFVDMDTFIFQSNSIVDDCVFRRCNQITSGGASFTNSTFASGTGTYSITTTSLSSIGAGCSFSGSGNTALELTGPAGSYTWNATYPTTGSYDYTGVTGNGVEITGASITGNEAIYIPATAGTFIISVSDAATTPTVATAGAIVNIVAGQRTLALNNIENLTEIRIYTSDLVTELAGIETITTGASLVGTNFNTLTTTVGADGVTRYNVTYTFNQNFGNIIVVGINPKYLPIRVPISLEADNISYRVVQIFDRNYDEGSTPFSQ